MERWGRISMRELMFRLPSRFINMQERTAVPTAILWKADTISVRRLKPAKNIFPKNLFRSTANVVIMKCSSSIPLETLCTCVHGEIAPRQATRIICIRRVYDQRGINFLHVFHSIFFVSFRPNLFLVFVSPGNFVFTTCRGSYWKPSCKRIALFTLAAKQFLI